MSRFSISFYPELPREIPDNSEILPAAVDWRRVLNRVTQQFDLEYIVNGRRVRYYPSPIIQTVDDLISELQQIRTRKSHTVLLSGYPVLDVMFEGDLVRFYYAHELAFQQRKPINGAIHAEEIERALQFSLRQVWSVVRAAERAG